MVTRGNGFAVDKNERSPPLLDSTVTSEIAMLTAENNQTPDDNSNTGPTSTVGGFGNVLKSVQGLQQRLSDFSLDDVTAAEANANTLIHRIASVQQKLIELANLKRNLTAVAGTIHQIPETDFDLISPDSLERHPQLHAIVKTSKIIRLHKLLKVAKASAQSVSFDSEVGRLEIGTPLAPTISLTKAEKYPERLSKTSPEPKPSKPAASWQNPNEAALGTIELPSFSTIINTNTDHALLKRAGTETIQEKLSDSLMESSSGNLAVENLATLSEPKAAVVSPDTITESVAAPSAIAADSTLHPDTLARDHEFPPMTPPKIQTVKRAVSASETTPEFDDERRSPVSNSAFNQRLLDDLIQNYGEFFVSPKPSTKPAPIHVDIPIAPEPNFVEAEPVVAVEMMTVEAAQIIVPTVRSHGELDRQLKKLVKDYGEYDKYSHHSSLNLKKSAITAFVVLALVLAAVYFFRSPAQTISQPVPATQFNQTSPSVAPGSSKERSAALAAEAKQKTDNSNDPTAPPKIKQKQKP